MIGMKVRYEIGSVNLKISNVTPRDADSYVLLTASDENNNEVVFALSNEQAEHLEAELYEANRRRRVNMSSAQAAQPEVPHPQDETQPFGQDEDQGLH